MKYLMMMLLFLCGNAAWATRCCDGTYSSSSGQGTCSWHGGVCNGRGLQPVEQTANLKEYVASAIAEDIFSSYNIERKLVIYAIEHCSTKAQLPTNLNRNVSYDIARKYTSSLKNRIVYERLCSGKPDTIGEPEDGSFGIWLPRTDCGNLNDMTNNADFGNDVFSYNLNPHHLNGHMICVAEHIGKFATNRPWKN